MFEMDYPVWETTTMSFIVGALYPTPFSHPPSLQPYVATTSVNITLSLYIYAPNFNVKLTKFGNIVHNNFTYILYVTSHKSNLNTTLV